LATPKSITFGTGRSSYRGGQHVRRLDVAVDNAFLMSVLDRLADRHEQLQPLPRREPALIAEFRDWRPLDQFHDEEWPAVGGRAGVEDAGNVRMIHQGERLPFRFEAGQHLTAVHARFDDLERDYPADRLVLLGHVDDAHAPFADLFQQFVRPNLRAGTFAWGLH
jgi:hypothetical protein